MKPPRDSSPEDRLQLHREEMRNRAARRLDWHLALAARHARTRQAVDQGSIWPKGKVAKPGRMA